MKESEKLRDGSQHYQTTHYFPFVFFFTSSGGLKVIGQNLGLQSHLSPKKWV
jgi:hypothetical protein